MGFGPLGIWEIILIVGVALLIFGPAQLPKIARGVGKAVKTARDVKDEITGIAIDDEPRNPGKKKAQEPAPPALEAPAAEAAEPGAADAAPDVSHEGPEPTPVRPPEPQAG